MKRFATLAVLALSVMLGTAPAVGAETLAQVAQTASHGFNIRMPGTPQSQFQDVQIPGGKVSTGAWTTQTAEGVIYSVSFADYPEPVAKARPAKDFLDEGEAGLANQLRGTVRSKRDVALDGNPGREFTVSSENGEVKARNYMVGRRLYTLLVLYNPSIGAPDADKFLGSLALRK